MNAAQLPTLSSDTAHGDGPADTRRAQAPGGFVNAMTNRAPACMILSVRNAQPWQKYGAVGLVALAGLLSFIGRQEYKRRVRRNARERGTGTYPTAAAQNAAPKKAGTSRGLRTINAPTVTGTHAAARTGAVGSSGSAPLYDPMADPRYTGSTPSVSSQARRQTAGLQVNHPDKRSAAGAPNMTGAFALEDEWGDDQPDISDLLTNSFGDDSAASAAARAPTEAQDPPGDKVHTPLPGSPGSVPDTLPSFDGPMVDPMSDEYLGGSGDYLAAISGSHSAVPADSASAVASGPAALLGIKLPSFSRLGGALNIGLAFSTPPGDALRRVQFSGVVTGPGGLRLPAFRFSSDDLQDIDSLSRRGRARVRLPGRVWTRDLADKLSGEGGTWNLELTASLDGAEHYASTELADSLTLYLEDLDGQPLVDVLAVLHCGDGSSIRASVGTEKPGYLRVSPVPVAHFDIEMLDDLRICSANARQTRRARVLPDGVDALRAGLDLQTAGTREIVIATPIIRYVAAGASGDGSESSPAGSLMQAITDADNARRASGKRRPIEIRVNADGVQPADRAGIVDGASGDWMKWWAGDAANVRRPWTTDLASLRDAPRYDHVGLAVEGEWHIDGVEDLRIVNRAFAELRARASRHTRNSENLDRLLGELPQAVFRTPESAGAFQWRFSNCNGLRLEGLHFVGRSGLSGVQLEACQDVLITRCWFERFASGPTANPSTRAAGRALHIRNSGTERSNVEIFECDIGWNSVLRPRMPVRAAAILAEESWVALTRCFIHDNVATDQPADIAITGAGRITGNATNHAVGNLVIEA